MSSTNAVLANRSITTSQQRLEIARRHLVRTTMRWTFGVFALAIMAASYYAVVTDDLHLIPLYIGLASLLTAIVFWPRVSYRVQIASLLAMMYVGAVLNFATEGRGALGRLFLIMMVYTAVLFLGIRAGLATLALGILTMLAFTWLFANGYMVGVPDVDSHNIAGWLSNTFFVLFIGLYIVLSLYYLLTNLLEVLRESNDLARDLQTAQATLEAQVGERTHTVELARREAEAARQAIEAQMWYTTGQAQLSEVMRGEQELAELAEAIIRHLCHYLDVPTGAFFVSTDLQTLNLLGRYAPADTSRQTRFEVGQGIVGEAARHKTQTVVDGLPADYLTVRSSLGTAVVSHLLLQPIYYADQLLGVIELGQWRPFDERQTTFIARISDSVAVTLHSARTRDYLKQLLENS